MAPSMDRWIDRSVHRSIDRFNVDRFRFIFEVAGSLRILRATGHHGTPTLNGGEGGDAADPIYYDCTANSHISIMR